METYLNLIPLLAGKMGLELYSPVFGKVHLIAVDPPYIYMWRIMNVILTALLIAAALFLYCAISGGNKDKEQ